MNPEFELRRLSARSKSTIDRLTDREWAQIRALIAKAKLDTATTMGLWIIFAVVAFVVALWPDRWWLYVPVMLFGNMAIRLPFERELHKANEDERQMMEDLN